MRARLEKAGFVLVGSRATGAAAKNADWDFAGHDTSESRSYLQFYGFVDKGTPRTGFDVNTTAIYELRAADGKVYQVALQYELGAKLKVTQALKMSGALRKLDRSLRNDKNARRLLWNALYAIAGLS